MRPASWYHGPIKRAEAEKRLERGGFLVRERVEYIWYEVMTPSVTITIRRCADGNGFKVLGIPLCFQSLEAAVAHLYQLGCLPSR